MFVQVYVSLFEFLVLHTVTIFCLNTLFFVLREGCKQSYFELSSLVKCEG